MLCVWQGGAVGRPSSYRECGECCGGGGYCKMWVGKVWTSAPCGSGSWAGGGGGEAGYPQCIPGSWRPGAAAAALQLGGCCILALLG